MTLNDPASCKPVAEIRRVEHGLLADFNSTAFPCEVYGVLGSDLQIEGDGTLFGFSWDGLTHSKDYFPDFPNSTVFSLPFYDGIEIAGGTGYCVVRRNYIGLPAMAGPIEEVGRLKYIDGCSDTLLIGPPVIGDPCMNLLHFPPSIDQTMHTHPSIRVGLIHRGRGFCRTATGKHPLNEGDMFILHPDAEHAFQTIDSPMTLTVFHPDSDTGPSHDDHPMLNRTIVEGVSAKGIDRIKTKVIHR